MKGSAPTYDPQSFDHMPEIFDRFHELVGGEVNDLIKSHLPDAGRRAVDLGCGSGTMTEILADHFGEVLAVDISEPMLALAERKHGRSNVVYQRRDLLDVSPDKNGKFDFVLSAYVLHHIPGLDSALQGIKSLVEPGGQVLLIDIVGETTPVPKSWFRSQARKGLRDDVLKRRRPPREAWELYRIWMSDPWLDHVSTDLHRHPGEFMAAMREALPGATFTPLYRSMAAHWVAGS